MSGAVAHASVLGEVALPAGLGLDYVEFYVGDLDASIAFWVSRYGCTVIGAAGFGDGGFHSVAVRHGQITLVLTEGTSKWHPACGYVAAHGDGVADIALRAADVRAAFTAAVARGARPVREPAGHDGKGPAVTAAVSAFGDVVHTLVQRRAGDRTGLPCGFRAVPAAVTDSQAPDGGAGLAGIDHFAVCVPAGDLGGTVDYYQRALGFRQIFEERIVVGSQAMISKVVQSARGVTLTLIEPDQGASPGQVDDFLNNHGGAGVQHIAFSCDDAVRSVRALAARGVDFLTMPGAYYDTLGARVTPARHDVAELRGLSLLVDQDHAGQLFQIFTRSVHPRRTLFFEVIERDGAETFGTANIKALYEAVEFERAADGSAAGDAGVATKVRSAPVAGGPHEGLSLTARWGTA